MSNDYCFSFTIKTDVVTDDGSRMKPKRFLPEILLLLIIKHEASVIYYWVISDLTPVVTHILQV